MPTTGHKFPDVRAWISVDFFRVSGHNHFSSKNCDTPYWLLASGFCSQTSYKWFSWEMKILERNLEKGAKGCKFEVYLPIISSLCRWIHTHVHTVNTCQYILVIVSACSFFQWRIKESNVSKSEKTEQESINWYELQQAFCSATLYFES